MPPEARRRLAALLPQGRLVEEGGRHSYTLLAPRPRSRPSWPRGHFEPSRVRDGPGVTGPLWTARLSPETERTDHEVDRTPSAHRSRSGRSVLWL